MEKDGGCSLLDSYSLDIPFTTISHDPYKKTFNKDAGGIIV